jgi:hypothetical protein
LESVVIVVPSCCNEEFRQRLSCESGFTQTSPLSWCHESKERRVYISLDSLVESEFSSEQLDFINNKVSSPVFYCVDFSDIEICKIVIQKIANDEKIFIDNDHGLVLSGSEYIRRMKLQPSWDWRIENIELDDGPSSKKRTPN